MFNSVLGNVFDIQRFTVHDGPGIRTEVFLKGCPLRCLWCHSPESQNMKSDITLVEIRCIGVENCGECLKVCPTGALKEGKTKYSNIQKEKIQLINIDRLICNSCGRCTEVCPSNALSIIGKKMSIDKILEIIEKDRTFYLRSNGGITISGGEPMLQYEFLLALLKECKKKGLHTCLDTTGYAKWKLYKNIIRYVDLVLYDLKHMDSKKSKVYTGKPNELILENAKKIAAQGVAMQIRIPIIPGYNDSEENLHATGKFCIELGAAVKEVQLLPYHRLGVVKYERLNRKYELKKVEPPNEEHMKLCKSIIEFYGLKATIH